MAKYIHLHMHFFYLTWNIFCNLRRQTQAKPIYRLADSLVSSPLSNFNWICPIQMSKSFLDQKMFTFSNGYLLLFYLLKYRIKVIEVRVVVRGGWGVKNLDVFSYSERLLLTLKITCSRRIYCKVASSNMSRLEAHAGFFRLLMKGIFNPYFLWPFHKKLISNACYLELRTIR